MTVHDLIHRQFGLPLTGIDDVTAEKGEKVYRAGRVHGLSASVVQAAVGPVVSSEPADDMADSDMTGWLLAASVEGSHGETYRTTVRLGRKNGGLRAGSACSCPVAGHCKHGAATLLAWLHAREGTASRSNRSPVDGAAGAAQQRSQNLLRRQHALHWARELNAVRLGPARPGAGQPELAYVLHLQERGGQLTVYRIRQLKNGDYARPERYLSLTDNAFAPPTFWDDVDAAVALTMLQAERSAGAGYSLSGPRAGDSLLALAKAGKLFVDEPPADLQARSLAAGPPLPGRIAWQVQGRGIGDATKAGT